MAAPCAGACPHDPPCGGVRIACVADAADTHAFAYTVGHVQAQGSEILVLNVFKGDHPRNNNEMSTIEFVGSMLSTLRDNALGGHAVHEAQFCAFAPEDRMPPMMLVEPHAEDVERFFNGCVTDRRRGPLRLFVLVPLTHVPAHVGAAGKDAVHAFLRDIVLPDFAAHLPAAQGQRGRAGSADIASAFEIRRA